MSLNFRGYGEKVLTFEAASSLTTTGIPVKMSGDAQVGPCSANDVFCGVCVNLRDGYAAVQLSGYVVLPAAAKLTAGYHKVAINASGKVAANENGREVLVVSSSATEAGIIL